MSATVVNLAAGAANNLLAGAANNLGAGAANNLAAGAVEALPRGFPAAANDQIGGGPAKDAAPQAARRSSLFLLFSTKWVSFGRFQLPIWAHVGVLLLDRANNRATLYDVVSCGARKGARS